MTKQTAEKVLKLERLWSELLAKSPSKDNLAEVVRLVPELRDKAWQAYCATNPTSNELLDLITSWKRPEVSLVHYPALLLIERYGDTDTLLYLIENISGEVRIAAAEKLLAGDCDERTLACVLKRIKEDPLRVRIADRLLNEKQSKEEDTLCDIIGCAPERAQVAGKRLLEQETLSAEAQLMLCAYAPSLAPELMARYKDTMSLDVLFRVMYANPACANEAGQMLLQKSTRFYELFGVFDCCPHLREQAWQEISTLPLNPNQANRIAEAAPEYGERAAALVVVPPRTADTILGEILVARYSL